MQAPCSAHWLAAGEASHASDVSWSQLPYPLQLHIVSLLPPNDRALSGRLVCRDARNLITDPDHLIVVVSQPLPRHAESWAKTAGQPGMRLLPYSQKLQLLSTAASTGSETSLEVVWSLLQPCVSPDRRIVHDYPDPGEAAVTAGHPQLLGWLLRRCPALVRPHAVLRAAALHCDLPGLQTAWEALQAASTASSKHGVRLMPRQETLDAAAESATPDALAKMQWALGEGGRWRKLQQSTAVAAARSGDLGRLRWLRDSRCPMDSFEVLLAALEHADLCVVQWLLDEAGCRAPEKHSWDYSVFSWRCVRAAASSSGGAEKIRLLLGRGVLLQDAIGGLLPTYASTAVEHGSVEVLQYFQSLHEPGASQSHGLLPWTLEYPAPGSVAMGEHLLEAGYGFSLNVYRVAVRSGNLAVIRWLQQQAGLSAAGLAPTALCELVEQWAGGSKELMEVVQLVVDAGYSEWDAEDVLCAVAKRGDLGLAQYLQQLKPVYRPAERVLAAAVLGGCGAMLEWLVKQLACRMASLEVRYLVAAARGDWATLLELRRLGVPWGAKDVLAEAVKQGCGVQVLRWLAARGMPVGGESDMRTALAGSVHAYGKGGTGTAEWLMGLATPRWSKGSIGFHWP